MLYPVVVGLALAGGLAQAQPLLPAHSAAITPRGLEAFNTSPPRIARQGMEVLAVAAQTTTAVRSQHEDRTSRPAAGFVKITSAQLDAMLRRKDFFLVNVHIPYEGEIAGTDAFVPYNRIGDQLDQLPKDKSAKIVLYCRTGRMSDIAARELARRGYTRISELVGGMVDWKKKGHKLIEN